jgi:hypothetical protein
LPDFELNASKTFTVGADLCVCPFIYGIKQETAETVHGFSSLFFCFTAPENQVSYYRLLIGKTG